MVSKKTTTPAQKAQETKPTKNVKKEQPKVSAAVNKKKHTRNG